MCKFIQCFSQVCNRIPRINDAEVIAAFRNGFEDLRMREKMAVHDVRTAVELFKMADKCALAAEARDRPTCANDRKAGSSHDKKNQKHKQQAVLTADPDWKQQKKRGKRPPTTKATSRTASSTTRTPMTRQTAARSRSWGGATEGMAQEEARW